MSTVIKVENLSKAYRLGVIGSGTLREDLNRWWVRARGRPDPLIKIGQEDHGNVEGETVWALRDVSFEVEQGEILGIIGPNGAGKSTLLKILTRITAPTSGRAEIQGRVGSLLEVGTGFHPELTGRENVYLNGAILGMRRTEIDRKFDEIVDFSGVEKYIDTPVKRYSSGMRVRLGFAVAAHLDPEILLVDEVLAVGDAAFQKKCLGKMGEVSKEGRTVLFVSHNMGAVQSLCDWAILLEEGRVASVGDTEEVIQHYLCEEQEIRSHGKWDDLGEAPGNAQIRVREYLVKPSDNLSPGFVRLNDTLEIHIKYELLRDFDTVDVSLHFFSDRDVCLFVAGTGFDPELNKTRNKRGVYEAVLNLPDNPLNEGSYHATVRFIANRSKPAMLRLHKFLSFEVIRDENHSDFFLRKTKGFFKPRVHWTKSRQKPA